VCKLKISIVTAVFNRVHCIGYAVESLQKQTYADVEHVVIDGASTDGTLEILRQQLSSNAVLRSEHDDGIYDALNKGFLLATGDVIGILHSDDTFYDVEVIENVVNVFNDPSVDYVYGDIVMVGDNGQIVRYWRPGELNSGRIKSTQIPHPALFLSRALLDKISPPFDSSYRISADLKQQLIIANIVKANGVYIPAPLVKMKIGGESTGNILSYFQGWFESRRAWNEVHGAGGTYYVLRKVLSKLSGIRM